MFISILQRRKLRSERSRDLPKVTQLKMWRLTPVQSCYRPAVGVVSHVVTPTPCDLAVYRAVS